MFYEDRSKEIKLWFLFKRDLNLKGRVKQKGNRRKTEMIHINIRHIETLLLLLSFSSCVRLCDPMDSSPPGSLSTGLLEWVAISFSI